METKDNKYFKWYWNICENAKNREVPEGYTEKHHIYPVSIYGDNDNLITLTAKEHYIVHLVLWWGLRTKYGSQDENTQKMRAAFACMNMKNEYAQQRYDSKLYEYLKIAYSEMVVSEETRYRMSIAKKGKGCGEDNNMYGRCAYDIWLEKYGEEEATKRQLEANKKNSEALKGHPNWNHLEGIPKTPEHCKNISLGLSGVPKTEEHKANCRHPKSKEGRENIKIANQKRRALEKELGITYSGDKNPMYGKNKFQIWVDKYGLDEAHRRQTAQNIKAEETRKLNKLKKDAQ